MKRLIITGGTVWTGRSFASGHSVLIEDGRIVAVAHDSQFQPEASAGIQEVRLSGESVLPGFVDSHLHLTTWAKQRSLLNLGNARSRDELLEMVREEARRTPADRWIRGWNYNETRWTGCRSLKRADLDSLAIPNPVLLQRVCTHINVANSRALELTAIASADGVLEERDAINALRAMEMNIFSRDVLRKALKSACSELASLGATGVHPCGADDYGMEEDLSLYEELRNAGELPLRVFTYHDSPSYPPMPSGFGNEWVRYQGLKIFLDGSLGGRTAALSIPYSDSPCNEGRLNWTDEQVLDMLRTARQRGVQTQLHAIGDRALDQALDCISTVDSEYGPAKLKDRVNHLIVCRPDQRSRLAELGVFCDIQPSFVPSDSVMAPLRLGPERLKWAYRWRSIMKECGPISASSDTPVESPNPLHSLWALMERPSKIEKTFAPEERLTLEEALPMLAENPYRAIGLEEGGRIEAGCLADIAVLDRDISNLSGKELRDAGVLCTIAGGRFTHGGVKY
ncbi:MAG: amidohydrolase [Synergistaceae bacterium]|nr:amidohydrolase [Synergistota bacterium]NLM70519.1 amidohydrolase [Synergistaceae bacterium]